jgi:very-short-patch-repair endonuclease
LSKKSDAEELFAQQLELSDLPPHEYNYQFHPERKWEIDFAWPEQKVALEVEGWGRHQTWQGFRNDCEKYNEATMLGWKVFRVPADLIDMGVGIYYVEHALNMP